jgi:hypothetical protein
MPKPTTIPLAFALAISASTSHADVGFSDPSEAMRPGRLGPLLGDDQSTTGQLPKGLGRLSQWFNGGWFSCFAGGWRRC